MAELEPGTLQSLRSDPGAGKQQLVGHFSESEPCGERGHGQNRRARQHAAQRLGELRVRYGVGSDGIHRPVQHLHFESVMYRRNRVVKCDPTHILFAAADDTPDTHLERNKHLCQCSAFRAEDDTETQKHHPNSGIFWRGDGRLPRTGEVRKKAATRRTILGENLVAAVAVIADCGRRNKHFGWGVHPRQPLAQHAGATSTTLKNPLFERGPPACRGNVLASQVHNALHAVQRGGIKGAGSGVPRDSSRGGCTSYQRSYVVLPAVKPFTHDVSTVDLLDAAEEAFSEVSRQTGRRMAPLLRHGPESADYVLLVAGSAARLAIETVDALEGGEVACAAVVVSQIRPFPDARLRELGPVRRVAVLADGDDGMAELLASRARAVLCPDRSGVDVIDIRRLDQAGLIVELSGRWDLELPQPAAGPVPDDEPFVVGGLPSNQWTEELLLDAGSWLTWLGDVRLDSRAGAAGSALTVTVGGSHQADRLLDLLVLTDPAALPGTEPLVRLRECGVLLVIAASEDPQTVWAAFAESQRQEIVRRRQRLCIVPPGRARPHLGAGRDPDGQLTTGSGRLL